MTNAARLSGELMGIADAVNAGVEVNGKVLSEKLAEASELIYEQANTALQLSERNKELEEALRLANHTLSHLPDSLQKPQARLVYERVEEFRLLLAKEQS